MKIKTQVIDKIEDVREGDVVVTRWSRSIAYFSYADKVEGTKGERYDFEGCTVVRITVKEE